MKAITKYICKCGKGMGPMMTFKDACISFYCKYCGRAVTTYPKEMWFEHKNIEKQKLNDWEVVSKN